MEYINDFLEVYKKAGKDTLNSVIKNPLIVFMPIIYSILFGLVQMLSFRIGFGFSRIWGVLVGLVYSMIISSYFTQLDSTIHYDRLNLKSLPESFLEYIWGIYFVRFIFYVLSLFLANILYIPLISLGVFLVLNPMGEAIYLKKTNSLDTFTYSIEYMKDNWHLWLPHAILSIFAFGTLAITVDANPLDMYLSSYVMFNAILTAGLILMGVYAVFRGHLFKNTHNSSMRKRKYMGAF